MDNLWRDQEAGTGEIEQVVYLSNLIGRDPSLVQPGGGNTSVKVEETDVFGVEAPVLIVKGSGTDLRTVAPGGFTHLYVERLAKLQGHASISDEEMMRLMRASMLFPERDPLPSVETPLHSLLPYRYVAHTHDVATLSVSNTPSAQRNVERVFGRTVAFLPYARPGFPLAKLLAERLSERPIPSETRAMVLEKHGLAVWGENARECYEALCDVINTAEAFVADNAGQQRVLVNGPSGDGDKEVCERARAIMPALRGALSAAGWSPVLHFDGQLAAPFPSRLADLASRGVMTPEHILRAGRTPLILELGSDGKPEPLAEAVRGQVGKFHRDYVVEIRGHGQDKPIADALKTVIVPGTGIFYAGKDKRNARVAADCHAATLRVIEGAEAIERFEFISTADAIEMEYWPLERRKVEESAKPRRELEGKIAVVIGAASGIGRATALRFAREGAHVVLADVDEEGSSDLASEINAGMPERALPVRCDVSEVESVEELFRSTVLQFGGIDVLFYSPGVGPSYQPVIDMSDEEIEEKLAVHFQGAVRATKDAARIMLEQGLGGRLVYNASKAAFAPGAGFAAYGASKAALVHYVRNVASELGRYGITANYINADAIDTPLFRRLVRERAERQGKTEEELLAAYEERSILRKATIPAEAVAEAALFLASDRSAYTTGCVITVGGGAEGFPR